jgi:uncharacterized membrane protein
MTIARIIAITAVVCAAMGATTQADAAKRKPAGHIELDGCASGNVGSCWGTQVQVISWKPNPKISCMWR